MSHERCGEQYDRNAVSVNSEIGEYNSRMVGTNIIFDKDSPSLARHSTSPPSELIRKEKLVEQETATPMPTILFYSSGSELIDYPLLERIKFERRATWIASS